MLLFAIAAIFFSPPLLPPYAAYAMLRYARCFRHYDYYFLLPLMLFTLLISLRCYAAMPPLPRRRRRHACYIRCRYVYAMLMLAFCFRCHAAV